MSFSQSDYMPGTYVQDQCPIPSHLCLVGEGYEIPKSCLKNRSFAYLLFSQLSRINRESHVHNYGYQIWEPHTIWLTEDER